VPGLGALLLVACGSGTETGNPSDTLRLGVGALPGRAPEGLSVEQASVSLPSLFVTACPGDAPAGSAGPAAVDLLAPGPHRLEVPGSGDVLCGMTLELAPSHLAAPAELAGLSVLFMGMRADGVPFELRSTISRHYPLVTNPPDSPLDARSLFVGFDLAVWLDAAGVPSLPSDAGAVVVDATHNVTALDSFDAAAVHAIALYLDVDRDGELDPGEDTPVALAE